MSSMRPSLCVRHACSDACVYGAHAQADICQLLALFGPGLLGYRRVSARLEVLAGTPCPRWHADHVGVRCLVTYLGPGTQVVENRWAGTGGFGEGRGGRRLLFMVRSRRLYGGPGRRGG